MLSRVSLVTTRLRKEQAEIDLEIFENNTAGTSRNTQYAEQGIAPYRRRKGERDVPAIIRRLKY